ncbi:MAG: hypothetical protein AB2L07_06575 [Thermoanaerobaculaceae bacterium]
MIGDLLPKSFDGTYHGRMAALWLLGFVAFSKIVMGPNCIFNGRYVATVADGVPLDSFTPAGAQAVVAMLAAWGLSGLVLGALSILVLVRYRGMVPFMLAVLVLEHVCRRLIFVFLPIARTGGSAGWLVNLVLLAFLVAGLALSVWRRPSAASEVQG